MGCNSTIQRGESLLLNMQDEISHSQKVTDCVVPLYDSLKKRNVTMTSTWSERCIENGRYLVDFTRSCSIPWLRDGSTDLPGCLCQQVNFISCQLKTKLKYSFRKKIKKTRASVGNRNCKYTVLDKEFISTMKSCQNSTTRKNKHSLKKIHRCKISMWKDSLHYCHQYAN